MAPDALFRQRFSSTEGDFYGHEPRGQGNIGQGRRQGECAGFDPFYFLPVFLGYMAAKAMKCNEIIAMMLGAFLCYPQIDAIVQDVATETAIFGIPVIKGVCARRRTFSRVVLFFFKKT